MAVRMSDHQVVEATLATRLQPGGRAHFEAVCTDSRHLTPGCLFVALKGERFDGHDFLQQAIQGGAAGVVVERGRSLAITSPDVAVYAVAEPLAALGALARYHRARFRIPLGAVTGSNGKTTTKELIAAILEQRGPALKTRGNLNNEVGLPLTLFELSPGQVAAVVELGMNHLGEIRRLTAIAQPTAGLITTVQPAHLAGVGSIEGVATAKGELFHALGEGATAVVNTDEARIATQTRGIVARQLTWGRSDAVDVRLLRAEAQARKGMVVTIRYQRKDYPCDLQLVGAHNAMNATGAFAMGLALGYSPEECARGLGAARSSPRRLQVFELPNRVTLVDDCYNANPASMSAALETITSLSRGGRAVAVLGDMLELGEEEASAHRQLAREAVERVDLVAFFGPRLSAAYGWLTHKKGGAVQHFEEVSALLHWLRGELRPGDVVLVKASRGMRLERVSDALRGEVPSPC